MGFETRSEQTRQYKKNWGDILKDYPIKYGSFSAGLQAESPFPDTEAQPMSAISCLNQSLGVFARDDKKAGIQSSTLN